MSSPQGLDPWSALSLERGTTDPATIRRAYAAALRAHPPEDDPAGFRRVRDAYEFLTRADPDLVEAVARGEAFVPRDPVDLPRTPGPAPAPPPPAQEVRAEGPETGASTVELEGAWTSRLDTALALGEADDRPRAVRAALEHVVAEALEAPAVRVGALERVLARRRAHDPAVALATALPGRAVVASLGHGTGALAPWSADLLTRAGDLEALRRLAREVEAGLGDAGRPETFEPLLVFLRGTLVAAADAGRRLLDRVWKQAPAEVRRRVDTSPYDLGFAMGLEVVGWPPWARALLARVAFAGEFEGDPGGGGAGRLRGRVAATPPNSSVRAFLAVAAPGLVPSARASLEARPRAVPAPASWSGTLGGLALFLFLLVRLTTAADRCSGSHTERIAYEPPRYHWPLPTARPDSDALSPAERSELEAYRRRMKSGPALSGNEMIRYAELTVRGTGARSQTPALSAQERRRLADLDRRSGAGEQLTTEERLEQVDLRQRTSDARTGRTDEQPGTGPGR